MTIEITVGAWLVSAILGLVLAVARDTHKLVLTVPVTGAIEVIRAIPQLIILYIIFFGLGSFHINLDPLTAIVGRRVRCGIHRRVLSRWRIRSGTAV